MTPTHPLVPMASAGCACCASTQDGSGQDIPAAVPTTPGTDGPGAPAPAPATTYRVEGMTCGHCARAVTTALEAVDGVHAASIELVPGGVCAVTVTSDRPVPFDSVRVAVEDAGYSLAPS